MAEDIIYVKLKTSDTWHFKKGCSNYPGNDAPVEPNEVTTYKGAFKKPSYGEFCNECSGKSKKSKPQA